jgi:hypothetical protein
VKRAFGVKVLERAAPDLADDSHKMDHRISFLECSPQCARLQYVSCAHGHTALGCKLSDPTGERIACQNATE